ncbi:DUF2958 domain-containing protein [Novosphingobium malaysiense]|uniref:DUF2958 domain-containing protein n=1 Tax=Novosphingobium malaysiense TaxID=1348853 RepID=UPI00068D1833|nr:DUF2958 domain-containing protein [Novosphingobium malaysiense]
MILLTPELRRALRANDLERVAALEEGRREPDPVPVAKFFNPMGGATWLASELDEDGDTLFGLADLGFGCPELGSFSLAELGRVRLPFGLGIERDIAFASDMPLSVWADTARREGSILAAETRLLRVARNGHAAPRFRPGLAKDREE